MSTPALCILDAYNEWPARSDCVTGIRGVTQSRRDNPKPEYSTLRANFNDGEQTSGVNSTHLAEYR